NHLHRAAFVFASSLALFACFPGMMLKRVAVVPATDAPKPVGEAGAGWRCCEYRSSRGEASTHCFRTLHDRRRSAAAQERTTGGSTRDPVFYNVGMCAPQPKAYCTYLWSSFGSGGEHGCYAALSDCKRLEGGFMGGVDKMSACTAYD